jgi:pyridoxal phosphate enzyme (YggS family)
MTLESRYHAIREAVDQACRDCGRTPDEVRIVAVSKTVGVDAVREAVAAGIHDFGENRPEQLALKHDALPQERWHFIGNIQSRQLNQVVGRACLIHSLYQEKHADRIERLAAARGIVQDVLIEVNDGEDNKQGLDAADLFEMVRYCSTLEHVRVRGLMGMAPQGDLQAASRTFERLAKLRDGLRVQLHEQGVEGVDLDELSMGMSDDYLTAIPAGTTMVRIGRAIFSDAYEDPTHAHRG